MFQFATASRRLIKPFMNIRRHFQVAVVGASRPLDTSGVAKDLSYIPRQPLVESCTGRIESALRGSDLVVITVGQQRKPRQNDLFLFRDNADFIIFAMQEVKMYCPNAFIAIATEPINYIIPLASKVLDSDGAYEKRKLLGVTGLDTMRTQTCVSSIYKIPANRIKVPVICGHSMNTIVSLLSHVNPNFNIDDNDALTITEAVRQVDDNISSLMFGKKTLLSAAYATYCTASAILNAMNGFAMQHVAFIANNDFGTKFFASPVIITSQGVSAKMQFHSITDQEANYIYQATDHLGSEVRSGELYYIPTGDCIKDTKANQCEKKFTKTL